MLFFLKHGPKLRSRKMTSYKMLPQTVFRVLRERKGLIALFLYKSDFLVCMNAA